MKNDINENTALSKTSVSGSDSGRIDVENSKSYWAVNANYPNNWTLQKDYFHIGKNSLNDKSGFHIYGSVGEVMYGENLGKIRATIPCYDEEEDSDMLELGFFNTVDEAMKAVLERNFPEFSSNYF